MRDNRIINNSPETEKGIDFLGYFIKPNYTLVRRKVVKRFKAKISKNKEAGLKEQQATANSYLGHFVHANSYRLRKEMCEKHFNKFKFKKQYKSLKIADQNK